MSAKRGKFIVVEGCDRCGKTTQCQLVVKKFNLSGISARSTKLGILINQYLNNELTLDDYEIHLLFTLNRWEFVKEIETLVQTGTNLIVDRYSYSGIAYSAIKKDVNAKFCYAAEFGLPRPDSVLFLEGSVETASRRNGFGSEVYEREDVQTKVLDFFKSHFYPSMRVINAEGTVEQVNERLMSSIEEVIAGGRKDGDGGGGDGGGGGLGKLDWKGSEFKFSEEDILEFDHVKNSVAEAKQILEESSDGLKDDLKLEKVLRIVRCCAGRMRASS